jgi:hypothetical protein
VGDINGYYNNHGVDTRYECIVVESATDSFNFLSLDAIDQLRRRWSLDRKKSIDFVVCEL